MERVFHHCPSKSVVREQAVRWCNLRGKKFEEDGLLGLINGLQRFGFLRLFHKLFMFLSHLFPQMPGPRRGTQEHETTTQTTVGLFLCHDIVSVGKVPAASWDTYTHPTHTHITYTHTYGHTSYNHTTAAQVEKSIETRNRLQNGHTKTERPATKYRHTSCIELETFTGANWYYVQHRVFQPNSIYIRQQDIVSKLKSSIYKLCALQNQLLVLHCSIICCCLQAPPETTSQQQSCEWRQMILVLHTERVVVRYPDHAARCVHIHMAILLLTNLTRVLLQKKHWMTPLPQVLKTVSI